MAVPFPQQLPLPLDRGVRPALAVLLCAGVFFLGAADLLFATRAFGVNIRWANLLLAAGLAAWAWRHGADAWPSLRRLAIGWLPFVAIFAVAALLSAYPLGGLVKVGWFAFNMLAAWAWCQLFATTALARGYFLCYGVLAAIVVADFATGFTLGPAGMIGYGQPNALVDGHIVYRPHAFYYEPSYAASALGLAWALSFTRLREGAPWLALLLAGLGLIALVLLMSRTGLLYVAVFCVLAVLVRDPPAANVARRRQLRTGMAVAIVAIAVALPVFQAVNRTAFADMSRALGVQQTYERVCPLLQQHVPLLALECLDDEARRRSLDPWNALRRPIDTSEGQRVAAALRAVETVMEAPLLGQGVHRGEQRLLEPVASNVWLEIATEGGLLSAAAFAWGLAWSMWRSGLFAPGHRRIAVAFITYFAVAWQFLQTFPRLDQWLAFWFALTVVSRLVGGQASPARAAPGEGVIGRAA